MRFSGKSVVITGAASGIGRQTARLFASEGANVLAVDLAAGPEDGLAGNERIQVMRADSGSEEDTGRMIAEAVSRFGGIDVVVANAGVTGKIANILEETAQGWAEVARVNLIGPFLAIKYGVKAMLAANRPGAIVCTASVAGLRAGAGPAAYSATKAGVINLVQVAAQEFSASGIRINAICPGLTETGMTKPLFDSARGKGIEDRIGLLNPLKRAAQPEDMASAIAFLASEEASYINGHALIVDGGLSSSLPFSRPRALGEVTL